MGRPRELEDAKTMPIVLDQETRKIVEMRKGDRGISAYIRNLIREKENVQEPKESVSYLKEKLKEAEAKIASFERKEKTMTREKEEVMAYIAKGLELYKKEDERRVNDPEICRSWIDARCKGSGISTVEFLNYNLAQGELR